MFNFSAFVCVTARLLVHSRNWNWILLVSFTLSVVAYLVTMMILDQAIVSSQSYDSMFKSLSSLSIWLAALLNIVVGLLPYVVIQAFWPLVRHLAIKSKLASSDRKTYPVGKDESQAYYINVTAGKNSSGFFNKAFVGENDKSTEL